jgi:hypothetical protein
VRGRFEVLNALPFGFKWVMKKPIVKTKKSNKTQIHNQDFQLASKLLISDPYGTEEYESDTDQEVVNQNDEKQVSNSDQDNFITNSDKPLNKIKSLKTKFVNKKITKTKSIKAPLIKKDNKSFTKSNSGDNKIDKSKETKNIISQFSSRSFSGEKIEQTDWSDEDVDEDFDPDDLEFGMPIPQTTSHDQQNNYNPFDTSLTDKKLIKKSVKFNKNSKEVENEFPQKNNIDEKTDKQLSQKYEEKLSSLNTKPQELHSKKLGEM